MTKKYELVLILDSQLGDGAFDPAVEKYESRLVETGAEITNVDRWGLRKMAFTSVGLKRRQQGYYVLYQFEGESGSIDAMLQELKLDEDVLRYMHVTVQGDFVRVPQLAAENVYIHTRPDRDYRGGRGRFQRDRPRDGERRPAGGTPDGGGEGAAPEAAATPEAGSTPEAAPTAPAAEAATEVATATAEAPEAGANGPSEPKAEE